MAANGAGLSGPNVQWQTYECRPSDSYHVPEGSLCEINVEYGCCQCDTNNSCHLCFRYIKIQKAAMDKFS